MLVQYMLDTAHYPPRLHVPFQPHGVVWYFQYKKRLQLEGASEVAEDVEQEQPEEVPVDGAVSAEQEAQLQQQRQKKEQVQRILANVRQNFGKINVAPEFGEEDLVPVEMPDLDFSGSEGEEDDSKGEEDGEEHGADGEMEASETTTTQPGKANDSKSSRAVIRELDEKISKYKQFLDRAKSKRFSAIRSVCS